MGGGLIYQLQYIGAGQCFCAKLASQPDDCLMDTDIINHNAHTRTRANDPHASMDFRNRRTAISADLSESERCCGAIPPLLFVIDPIRTT